MVGYHYQGGKNKWNGILFYLIRFHSDFPVNRLTEGKNPKIYFQEQGSMVIIDSIERYYTNYYSSQSDTYWTEDFYDLKVGIDEKGDLHIYIPTTSTVMDCDNSINCGCVRPLTMSREHFYAMQAER